MKKWANTLKNITSLYYNWRKRNENLDAFLNVMPELLDDISSIKKDVSTQGSKLDSLEDKVQFLVENVDTLKRGTKMELFETLHNLYQTFVIQKGWASNLEKKEVEEIYKIYHDKLDGNGNGDRYYREILALPESEEEMEMKRNV